MAALKKQDDHLSQIKIQPDVPRASRTALIPNRIRISMVSPPFVPPGTASGARRVKPSPLGFSGPVSEPDIPCSQAATSRLFCDPETNPWVRFSPTDSPRNRMFPEIFKKNEKLFSVIEFSSTGKRRSPSGLSSADGDLSVETSETGTLSSRCLAFFPGRTGKDCPLTVPAADCAGFSAGRRPEPERRSWDSP